MSIMSNHCSSLFRCPLQSSTAVEYAHIQLCAQPWSAHAAMRCLLCIMLCALPHTGTTVPPAFAPVACTQIVAYKWPSCAGGGGLGHTDRPTTYDDCTGRYARAHCSLAHSNPVRHSVPDCTNTVRPESSCMHRERFTLFVFPCPQRPTSARLACDKLTNCASTRLTVGKAGAGPDWGAAAATAVRGRCFCTPFRRARYRVCMWAWSVHVCGAVSAFSHALVHVSSKSSSRSPCIPSSSCPAPCPGPPVPAGCTLPIAIRGGAAVQGLVVVGG
jgi:hypothetical protein